nr:hypothetical protein [Tanacetum cinerariifolium]GFA07532.1 hypothetical protein [Tanacetum cinerariifolium]
MVSGGGVWQWEVADDGGWWWLRWQWCRRRVEIKVLRRLVAMVVDALAASGDEDDEMERRLSAGYGRKRCQKWGGGKVEARFYQYK